MTTASDILKQIKDNDVKFVDIRFTDPRGKMQHVTMDTAVVDEDMFADGIMFDGSSIAGWKAINESDMVLMPDTETVHTDPFFAQSTLAIICDVLDPIIGQQFLFKGFEIFGDNFNARPLWSPEVDHELAHGGTGEEQLLDKAEARKRGHQ